MIMSHVPFLHFCRVIQTFRGVFLHWGCPERSTGRRSTVDDYGKFQ